MRKFSKAGMFAQRIEMLIAVAVPVVGLLVCGAVWLFRP